MSPIPGETWIRRTARRRLDIGQRRPPRCASGGGFLRSGESRLRHRGRGSPRRLGGASLLSSPLQNFNDFGDDGIEFLDFQMTDLVEHDVRVGREQSVRPNIARLSEAAGLEVFIGESESVSVPNLLAGDLTQNQVISLELRDNKCRASLGLSQIGEWEGDDDDIAF